MNRENDAVLWADLAPPDIRRLRDAGVDMVILPIGATEQHGAHLPLTVDTIIPTEIARRVSAAVGIPVLPPIPYGNSLTHRAWAGTIAIRPQLVRQLIEAVLQWPYESGFRRLLVLNGHIANQWPLRCAMDNLRYDFPDMRIRVLSWWESTPELEQEVRADGVGPSFHANDAETSVMMYLRPDLVHMDRVETEQSSVVPFFSYPMHLRTPSGVTGDPVSATPERGKTLVDMAVTGLVERIRLALREEPPYTAQ